MLIRNNEGMVCDAIARLLESRTGEQRADVRHPELDGVGPPVDLRLRLGIQEYAIEHTRLESFEAQVETGVGFSKISKHIEKSLTDKLPGPACYDLHVPVSVSLRGKAVQRNRALDSLVNWIREGAQCMDRRNTGQARSRRNPFRSDDCIRGIPPGFAW